MKIVMVWDGDYPWDVRVEKVGKSLVESGHEVHLVCRNSKALARREDDGVFKIRRVLSAPAEYRRLNAFITFPAFFSPLWLREIHRAVREIQPDLIIVRDLPMALGALAVAKLCKVPIAMDMAECYSEMLRCIWKFEDFRLQNVLVRNPYLADVVERIAVKNMDKIWVMVEESRDRLIRMGVPESRIEIVSNTPPIPPALNERASENDRLTITYIGLLNPSRGLRTVIDAAARLKQKGVPFRLVIAGDGKDMDFLRRKVTAFGLNNEVEFLGWVDHKLIGEVLAKSDAGIVPHYRCSHWDNTIPNKLFDYMSKGIPVIVSDARPTARIVNETKCGVVYKDTNPDDLASVIERLRDPGFRQALGRSGHAAVCDRYSWNFDSRVLAESVMALAHSSLHGR